MTSVGLLMVTDGRKDCFDAAARSVSLQWRGEQPTITVIVNDSGDPEYRTWLEKRTHGWDGNTRLVHHERRLGFGAAIESGWLLLSTERPDYVFHAEDDFLYDDPIPVADMLALLRTFPYLAQVSLLRQACNDEEVAAGGLVESRPSTFEDHSDGDLAWMEQRAYFTTNPSLYPVALCDLGWPQVPNSEGIFTHRLLEGGFAGIPGPDVRFGVLGTTADPPRVTHIGVRQGTGY